MFAVWTSYVARARIQGAREGGSRTTIIRQKKEGLKINPVGSIHIVCQLSRLQQK